MVIIVRRKLTPDTPGIFYAVEPSPVNTGTHDYFRYDSRSGHKLVVSSELVNPEHIEFFYRIGGRKYAFKNRFSKRELKRIRRGRRKKLGYKLKGDRMFNERRED